MIKLAPRVTAMSVLGVALLSPLAVFGQPMALPPPAATDPVTLQLMQGFPPPPDKVVKLETVLQFPNGRWAFHHMRELGPTAQVWRGDAPARTLARDLRDLDAVQTRDDKGAITSIGEWQRNTYTDGLIVLHRGRVVYDRTYAGMTAHQPHSLWSMSKSFTGLLATMMIKEGLIDAQTPVSRYLPELKDSAWGDATVQQTLDMTTGVLYKEDFRDPSSGIFQYLFAAGLVPPPPGYAGPRTIPELLVTIKKDGEHGTGFQYKTVDTEVIGWLLQRVSGKRYATLLSERIWSRIGAQDDGYVWTDPSGTQISSVGFSATLRDLARVGELMRLNGSVDGTQVFPASVVAELRQGADVEKFKASGQTVRFGYSYHNQWWIPHDADGTFEMKGLNGQHLHVNPAAELVIVKLSSHAIPDTRFTHVADRNAFAAIAAALKSR